MILVVAPADHLKPYVAGYYYGLGLHGEFANQAFHLAPHLGCALNLNLATIGRLGDGEPGYRSSITCVRSSPTVVMPHRETYTVQVVLTIKGLVYLFPAIAPSITTHVTELAALIGAHDAQQLEAAVAAAWSPARVACALNAWFSTRLAGASVKREHQVVVDAFECLQAKARVNTAATHMGVSERQFNRWFNKYLGASPSRLLELAKVRTSLLAIRSGQANPQEGFCDQTHLIRAWRRRFDTTPGRYRKLLGGAALLANCKPPSTETYWTPQLIGQTPVPESPLPSQPHPPSGGTN